MHYLKNTSIRSSLNLILQFVNNSFQVRLLHPAIPHQNHSQKGTSGMTWRVFPLRDSNLVYVPLKHIKEYNGIPFSSCTTSALYTHRAKNGMKWLVSYLQILDDFVFIKQLRLQFRLHLSNYKKKITIRQFKIKRFGY